MLTGDEQKLFRRLAVFVGGSALEATETICNIESDLPVLDTLESLLDKSLLKQIEAGGEPRFAMLETIREYAGDRLIAAGEEERVKDRHRDYFLSLAEQAGPKLIGPQQAAWLQRLEDEHENLRAGLEWSLMEPGSGGGLRLCGALQRFWWTRGHLSEGREWCLRVLGKAGAEERTRERAEVLNAAGVLAFYQGDYPAARVRHEDSLAIRRELGDRSGVATSLANLGTVARTQGNFASARALHEESLAIRREVGSRGSIGRSLNNLGNVALDQGDYPAARALHVESLAITRELGDRWSIANSLNNLGEVAYAQGDYPAARALHEEGLAIMRELGERKSIAGSLSGLGHVICQQGDFASARALHEESLVIRRELGDRWGIAESLERLAAVVVALGSPLRAGRIWGTAERLREEIGSPLPPYERPHYDQSVAAARAALGDDAAFDRAWQQGRALTLEQATAFALEETVERP